MIKLFIIVCIMIMPLNISVNVAVVKKYRKIFFGIYLYGAIKIFGGYIEKISEGLAIHYTNKKAIIIRSKDLIGARKSIKPFMDYHFVKFKTLTETGVGETVTHLYALLIINFINNATAKILNKKKPYLTIDNGFNLYANEDIFNLFLKSNVYLNLVMIVSSIIKVLTEKTVYAFMQRRNKNRFGN